MVPTITYFRIQESKENNMALDKDIVGSIEFLEVVGLQGSTYL